MPRLNLVQKSEAEGKQKELLETVESKMGRVPNILGSMAQSPVALEFYLQSSGLLSNGSFDAKTREAIALTVAAENSCDYCSAAHTAIGKGAGMSEEQAKAALKAEAEDPKLAAMLAFSKKVVADKGNVSDADYEQLTKAGVSQPETAELIANVVFNIYTNYFNHINQTEVDF